MCENTCKSKKTNWAEDISTMHTKFGVNSAVRNLSPELLQHFLEFRIKFIEEEYTELLRDNEVKDYDGVVDALIDLCVVAVGTLDAFDVDVQEAWNRVLEKNMQKDPGVNPNRPNKFNLPDMIKPEGWTAPSHSDNLGLFTKLGE